MDNDIIFKALSSRTRLRILQILTEQELHLSAIARKIKISVPVASKHIKILDKAGLITTRKIGNLLFIKSKEKSFEEMLSHKVKDSKVTISRKDSLLKAISKIPGIKIEEKNGKKYITSIDGEEGYYIYEIDGDLPNVSIDDYKPSGNIKVNLKKIISIDKKKISVKLEKK